MKYARYQTILIMLFSLPLSILAQDHQDYVTAEELYKRKKFDLCTNQLKTIFVDVAIYHDSTIAASYKLQGDLFLKEFDLKKTVPQYEKADSIYEMLGAAQADKRLNVVNKIGICYAQQENLIQTAHYFQTAYDIAIKKYAPDDLNVGKAINNLATVYLYLGDFERSLVYFHKSIAIKKKFADKNPIPLAKTYENVASIYGQINQMGKAESYFQKAGQLYLKVHEGNTETLVPYYINLAGFYSENERENDAITQLDLADRLPAKFKENKLTEILINKNYGVAYFQKKDFKKALPYFNTAIDLAEKYDVSNSDRAEILTYMANIYAIEKVAAKTKSTLSKAREILLRSYEKTHKSYLSILQQHVFILLKLGDVEGAKRILLSYEDSFKKRNELTSKDVLFSSLQMGLYAARLNYHLAVYQKYKQSSDLEKAINAADEVITYQDQILESIVDNESKMYFFRNAYANFSAAVYLYIAKYETNGEQQDLEKAFFLSEKTKQYNLKEARGFQGTELVSSISTELVEKEKQAKIAWSQAISKYENQLDKKADPNKMLALIHSLDSLKQSLQEATQQLSESSLSLSKYLNNNQDINLAAAKSWLQEKRRTYISYYLSGNDFVDKDYIFKINKEGLSITDISISKDSLNNLIHKLGASLKLDFELTGAESTLTAYADPAKRLYDYLVRPLQLEDSMGVIFNLDQKLHSLPFEVFVNDKTSKFLIEEHSISYAYSLNSVLSLKNMEYEKSILTSSPDFRVAGELNMFPLQNNKTEVREICELMGNKDIIDIEHKAQFQESIIAHSFNIIHLATHAKANHKRGYQSYLAFGNDPKDMLYSREIYGLPISANLVVLSACETGDGEFIESQGVLGLASAFAATGVQSLVVSLWSVNDVATKKLVVSYYSHLEKGLLKDDALRNAKLEYLASVPKSKRHPYYWAGFIQLGSINPIGFGPSGIIYSSFWLFVLLIVCMSIVGLYTLKQKRAASR